MTLKPRRVWCRHVRHGYYGTYGEGQYRWWLGATVIVGRSWRFCPICGTPRPTRKGAKGCR